MFHDDEFHPHDRPHGPGPEGPRGHGGRGHRPGPGEEGGRHGRGGPGPAGPGARGGRRGGGRGRAGRGDIRIATLLLLADQPMHGYQLMQAMADRTDGAWRPSPGAVYPTIALLEDEGLVTIQVDGGRKLVTLTDEGRAHVEERRAGWGDPFGTVEGSSPGPDLRGPLHELQAAARQMATSGTPEQVEAASAVLAEARRALYLILAGEAGA